MSSKTDGKGTGHVIICQMTEPDRLDKAKIVVIPRLVLSGQLGSGEVRSHNVMSGHVGSCQVILVLKNVVNFI